MLFRSRQSAKEACIPRTPSTTRPPRNQQPRSPNRTLEPSPRSPRLAPLPPLPVPDAPRRTRSLVDVRPLRDRSLSNLNGTGLPASPISRVAGHLRERTGRQGLGAEVFRPEPNRNTLYGLKRSLYTSAAFAELKPLKPEQTPRISSSRSQPIAHPPKPKSSRLLDRVNITIPEARYFTKINKCTELLSIIF